MSSAKKYTTTIFTLCLITTILLVSVAQAGPREQAKRLHDRLAGIPPTATILNEMEAKISEGNANEAALIAIENSAFYNVTLKNFVTPWTNEAQTVFAPLNDYTATVIGMVRDDIPFNQLLSADILYIGKSDLGIPAYSINNNDHYEALENQGIDLKENLIRTTQSSITGLPEEGTAGIITTRAAARAFFIDGTNRAMFRFTLLNHLCTDLEQIKDNTRPTDRIRQDVSRSPGGDSRIFMNSCVGCHAGMEPLTQAYAYYDFQYDSNSDPEGESGNLVYTPGNVQAKYLINASNFKYGFATPDDRWDNYWRKGPNAFLGWDNALSGSGKGAKSMGQELANSDAFASCQVEKVFKATCFRTPGSSADFDKISEMTQTFKADNYNLKQVFIDSAVYCMGE
ncbi:MAG TPA: hypothetical protein ENJ07_04005 [Gammaproteobacteria bacterium]|nr:hypothetical protein [Gammaproteobacteria bacterium]